MQTDHGLPVHRQALFVGGKAKRHSTNFQLYPTRAKNKRQKQIMDNLKKKADQVLESSLLISRDNFQNLFDHLDKKLTEKSCDNTK